MNGVHERVGEGNKADEIISIDVLHEVDKLLDREWGKAKQAEKQRICVVGAWMMGGFCVGLRGKEMLVVVDMLGTTMSVQRLMGDDATYPLFKFDVVRSWRENSRKALEGQKICSLDYLQ